MDQQTSQIHHPELPTFKQQTLLRPKAHLKIVEKPGRAIRFRYECEGRSAGSILGANSTPGYKTFPTIQIMDYVGTAVVVVSCVTVDKNPKYRAHPHKLVGAIGCKDGVCSVHVSNDTMIHTFRNLGIQCVKKKDVDSSLELRDKIRVDPFRMGFSHRLNPAGIALNSVRLCFQTFLKVQGKLIPLEPVISDPIYDKRSVSNLVICHLCACACNVAGGNEIILLCEKIVKDDIQVKFFEEIDGQVVWEDYGIFGVNDVHKQTAIKFRTPKYKTLEVDKPVNVFIQLFRPSDGATSEPRPFEYLPLDSNPIELKRKRYLTGGDENMYLLQQFQLPLKQEEQPSAANNENRIVRNIQCNIPPIHPNNPSTTYPVLNSDNLITQFDGRNQNSFARYQYIDRIQSLQHMQLKPSNPILHSTDGLQQFEWSKPSPQQPQQSSVRNSVYNCLQVNPEISQQQQWLQPSTSLSITTQQQPVEANNFRSHQQISANNTRGQAFNEFDSVIEFTSAELAALVL